MFGIQQKKKLFLDYLAHNLKERFIYLFSLFIYLTPKLLKNIRHSDFFFSLFIYFNLFMDFSMIENKRCLGCQNLS